VAKKKEKREREPEPPKFGGFKPLAGLKELKERMEAEKLAEKAAAEKAAKERASSGTGAGAKKKPMPGSVPTRAFARPAPSSSSSSDADDDLSFHRLMAGVVPLGEGKGRVPVTVPDAGRGPRVRSTVEEMREKARVEATEVIDHLHHLVDDVARFEVSDDGRHVEGRRVDVPPSVVRSLRRGLLPIDARIDLHGLHAEDARTRLLDFLRDKRQKGERCVLVIHGKGESVPGAGVLRGEISAWLSQGRAREHVAAFVTARDEDGGEGAVYVALRR
jgi:DNA-nicking Smr family endonuclease